MTDKQNIAWAAGLFEGEGHAGVRRHDGRGTKAQPALQLTMTDEDVVRRFADVIGVGAVYARPASGPNRKPTWGWSVQSASDVRYVVERLWPFLGIRRREQAMEALEAAAKIGESAGFCKRGHDLSQPEHLYVHRKTGKRHCRTCTRERGKAYRERRRFRRPAIFA
jgi:hypothetical protein